MLVSQLQHVSLPTESTWLPLLYPCGWTQMIFKNVICVYEMF